MYQPDRPRAGTFMQREIAEAPGVFARTVLQEVAPGADSHAPNSHATGAPAPGTLSALYTIARGSSDAAANILSYEFMRELGLPVTSLPPSVFSLGDGVALNGAGVLVVSQSGASDDLVISARAAGACGARVLALTNVPGSPVEGAAELTVPINAGPERAVPATKTVVGSIAAGMALLAAMKPGYRAACAAAAAGFSTPLRPLSDNAALADALGAAGSVFVIGRGAGYGAAREVALKLKETCALHAEAYSASEVLHGPLQLATRPLTVLLLDTGERATAASIDTAEARLAASGAGVFRLAAPALGPAPMVPAAAAALLLIAIYPVIVQVARKMGLNPDAPDQLAKVTRTL